MIPQDDDYKFWLLIAVIGAAFFLTLFTMFRLTPDPSIACVQSGGDWREEHGGHCEVRK